MMAALAAACLVALALVFKELAAVAFDPAFATASGLSVTRLDAVVAALSLAAVVIGLRVVGLVLIVALLVIPPAAARFWSDRLPVVVTVSALFGALSAFLGAAISAVAPGVPTGATIVVVGAGLFAFSLFFGAARGSRFERSAGGSPRWRRRRRDRLPAARSAGAARRELRRALLRARRQFSGPHPSRHGQRCAHHVMLPGVLAGFMLTGTTAVFAMLAGGVGAALVAVGLVSFLIRTAKVEPSAALGVVFTTLFAAGVLAMEQSGIARTAFDVHHVITGNLEALVWPTAKGIGSLFSLSELAEMPRALGRLAAILAPRRRNRGARP